MRHELAFIDDVHAIILPRLRRSMTIGGTVGDQERVLQALTQQKMRDTRDSLAWHVVVLRYDVHMLRPTLRGSLYETYLNIT